MISSALSRLIATAVVAIIPLAVSTCDPTTGESTLTGSLSVEATPSCTIEGDCSANRIIVTGQGFGPGARLKVYLPGDQVAGLGEVVLDPNAYVGGSGSFQPVERTSACAVIAHPGDARGALALVADDLSANVRRAATFVDTNLIVCLPPFTRSAVTQPCGSPDLCPTLSTDSATTVGVHWDNRDAQFDTFRVRYGARDADEWIETRELGGDVNDVAINNLSPGITYDFELLACHTHFAASSDCTGWVAVGSAATR